MWVWLARIGAIAFAIGVEWLLVRLLKKTQDDPNFRGDDSNYHGPI